ncbi:uncharacterized protein DSM5745_04995 [Aspergillus mulundensis]|uniref:Zn(2)-C6 fungal-type domain-containing protein n=1 Tax=Aspergillus mulundensis TaxID=1810919 RepID=A0A3D8S583_9EURO|nr:hypothetical protein DSM5745_04995 [Aspergillus mulundensis]RDW81438.1 hypothetical protein DSM5745_04995 [Aspergillus mulundensis]
MRKVKCDESFPVCNRCVSTGRICDGYGVWGGGGNQYGGRQSSDSPPDMLDAPPPLVCISPVIASMDDKASFDWFRAKTIVKLPGSYLSDFWTKILLQASHKEQAVWHAILALSTTHRVGLVETGSDPDETTRSSLEQTSLRHLIRAVRYLHPHFSATDKASPRVVLIVCLVFVVHDLLRGHFVSAQVHLRNGLSILAQRQIATQGKKLRYSEPIDDTIGEAFFRLHSQVELLQHQHCPRPCPLPEPLQPLHHPGQEHYGLIPSRFPSFTSAWRGLDQCLNEIFRLSAHARALDLHDEDPAASKALITHQQRITHALQTWLSAYNAALPTLQSSPSPAIAKAKATVHRLILAYHTMLTIMAATTPSTSETTFDTHTPAFKTIIFLLSRMWKLYAADPSHPAMSNPAAASAFHSIRNGTGSPKKQWIGTCDMGHTIVDIGWMIPLFYTATRCRERRVRRTAIQLLESTNHREGIWDAKITACIARRVMEIEEGDFYDGCGGSSDLDNGVSIPDEDGQGQRDRASSSSAFTSEAKSEPGPDQVLPESSRIRDLEVRMEGDPLERVLLFGSWEGMNGRVSLGEYDVLEQRWL